MIALNDTLSSPANFTPPMQISLLCTAKQGWHADVVSIAEFRQECGRAKCFSQSSKPNGLIFLTQCSKIVYA